MRYPKINSLYKRDEATGKFIWGCYSDTVFDCIRYWRVEEKIDGMNIRIIMERLEDGSIAGWFKGRNEDSVLPENLVKYLETINKPQLVFDFMKAKGKVILYGEGYGPKIQSGGNYRDSIGFILFDVWGGHRWSTREEVKAIAELLGLPVPFEFGIMTLNEICMLVKSKVNSPTAIRPMQFEGVIARAEPLLRNNYSGEPIMFKLKCKDM